MSLGKSFLLLILVMTFIQSMTVNASQVCFYENNNYQGELLCADATSDQQSEPVELENEQVKSINLPNDTEIRIYEDENFAGQSELYTGDTSGLSGWQSNFKSYSMHNDADADGVVELYDLCVHTPLNEPVDAAGCSASQTQNQVCFYEDNDYETLMYCTHGMHHNPNFYEEYQGELRGITMPLNTIVTIYEHEDYTGKTESYTANVSGLGGWRKSMRSYQIMDIDLDDDGVLDTVDQCLGTHPYHSVDANGCAANQLDDDNDGVANDIDQCANTPANEIADANGCSPSQQDADGDGIIDALDLCPGTMQGQTVNQYGCTANDDAQDADSDGVPDYLDQCPNTISGSTPDAQGCAPDQIDSDADGIPDYLDAYPHQGTQCSA